MTKMASKYFRENIDGNLWLVRHHMNELNGVIQKPKAINVIFSSNKKGRLKSVADTMVSLSYSDVEFVEDDGEHTLQAKTAPLEINLDALKPWVEEMLHLAGKNKVEFYWDVTLTPDESKRKTYKFIDETVASFSNNGDKLKIDASFLSESKESAEKLCTILRDLDHHCTMAPDFVDEGKFTVDFENLLVFDPDKKKIKSWFDDMCNLALQTDSEFRLNGMAAAGEFSEEPVKGRGEFESTNIQWQSVNSLDKALSIIAESNDSYKHLIQILQQHKQEYIKLIPKSVTSDDDISIGFSKYWGSPDLPPNFQWPTFNQHNLAFVAQLNCSQIKNLHKDDLLPTKGILYFFYDLHSWPAGYDPAEKDGWLVFFNNDTDNLVRTPIPPDAFPKNLNRLSPRRFEFSLDHVVPTPLSSASEHCGLDDELEKDSLIDLFYELSDVVERYYDRYGADHRMLSYPRQIQGEMELECQLVSHGIDCGGDVDYDSRKVKKFAAGAKKWKMLLQLGSEDSDEGMMWGDCGLLFFWIREDDLKRKNFENCWCIMQCS